MDIILGHCIHSASLKKQQYMNRQFTYWVIGTKASSFDVETEMGMHHINDQLNRPFFLQNEKKWRRKIHAEMNGFGML